MIKNILWKGLRAESLEYCSIYYKDIITVRSAVIGHYENLPYKLDYEIELDRNWVTRSFVIRSSLCNMDQTIALKHNGHGSWFGEGKEWKNLEGCIDIDISVSPFTNTLPVNRLCPPPEQSLETKVVYIDILEFRIRPERQLYTHLAKNTYRFTNDPGDFTADILTDDDGLVIHYPGLFERSLIRE